MAFSSIFILIQLKNNFTEDVVRKYPDVINNLEIENAKSDNVMKKELIYQNLKNLMNHSKKKETEVKKKDEEERMKINVEESLEKIEKNKGLVPKWVKFLFGSLVFLGSSAGLILLHKYRTKFYKS